MKKFLSMILAVLMIFSVMAPITVFAENGPYPYNPDSDEINFDEFSTIVFMDILADLADYDDPLEAMGYLYPFAEGYVLPDAFKGASYDLETNTLTLNNVKLNTAALYLTEMGDDFKIKLIGYNELATIVSSASTRGASITITGDGELVVNRLNEMSGIVIDAGETASVLHVEDSVKLKVYSDPEINQPSVAVYSSSVLNSSEIITLGGNVVADEPVFEKYTRNIYEQVEAYDLEWNYYDWYEFGLKKDGVYYVADEAIDEETYDYTGKYLVYSVAYDEILDCYVLNEYADGKAISLDGFTVVTEYEPMYDEELGYYIGYTDYPDEEDDSYKTIFDPYEKEFFDLCVDENETKYGFWQNIFEYDDGSTEEILYVYNLIEHPTYGYVAIEDTSRESLDGLTPLKIGEKELADSFVASDLVINNGGSIVEPKKIKNIKATSTNQGVKITWNADPVAEKYRIYRKASGDDEWTRLGTISAEETSFIDKTVKSGKKYTYTVKGYNFVGWGKFNSTGVTHTFYEAPDVTIKNTTKGVYLKWAKVAGATKYRIYRQTSGSSKWTLIDTVKGTSFTDKTAKSGKKYYYRVRSAKGDVMSGYNVVSKYFLSSPKLSSVKNVSSGVKVTWEKVNGAEGYKVYRKTSGEGYEYIGKSTKTTYTDKTSEAGTTYTYTVKAYKSKTNSSRNKAGLTIKAK